MANSKIKRSIDDRIEDGLYSNSNNIDLNESRDNGIYTYGGNSTNTPVPNRGGTVINLVNSYASQCAQIALVNNGGGIWLRQKSYGVFQEWTRLGGG